MEDKIMNENKNVMEKKDAEESYRRNHLEPRRSSLSFFHPFLDLFNDNLFSDDECFDLMRTDIKEEDDNYKLEVEIPGVDKKDVKISLDNGYLNIQAKFDHSSKEGEGKYIHYERSTGNYQRRFYVGEDIKKSDISASSNNGVLTIVLPKHKKVEENEDKYIEIK